MSASNAINEGLALASPNYSLNQILQQTNPQNKGGAFRKVLGAVVGGVGNMFAPGIGGLIGSAIAGRGGGINTGGLMGDTNQFLQLQQQMYVQQEAFETASAVMKSRHDAAMSSIQKMS
jgi:outer membrane lipoprotein SlyB